MRILVGALFIQENGVWTVVADGVVYVVDNPDVATRDSDSVYRVPGHPVLAMTNLDEKAAQDHLNEKNRCWLIPKSAICIAPGWRPIDKRSRVLKSYVVNRDGQALVHSDIVPIRSGKYIRSDKLWYLPEQDLYAEADDENDLQAVVGCCISTNCAFDIPRTGWIPVHKDVIDIRERRHDEDRS